MIATARSSNTFIAWLAALALCACGGESAKPVADSVAQTPAPDMVAPAVNDRRVILFAGTSLTAGYGLDPDSAFPHLIQKRIDDAGLPFETVNAGVSGETTAGLLQRLDWLLRGRFDVVVIESGANDGLRGVKVSAIEANLREIVRRTREAHPDALILLMQMEALPNYGRAYGTEFRQAYVNIARDMKLTLLPFLLDGVAGRAGLNQNDGVHPNLEGERIVAENVWKGLEPVLRERGKIP